MYFPPNIEYIHRYITKTRLFTDIINILVETMNSTIPKTWLVGTLSDSLCSNEVKIHRRVFLIINILNLMPRLSKNGIDDVLSHTPEHISSNVCEKTLA